LRRDPDDATMERRPGLHDLAHEERPQGREPAGAYRFVIADRASVHNFVLERAAGASSAT